MKRLDLVAQILKEANELTVTNPSTDMADVPPEELGRVTGDVDLIRQEFANCLDIDPSEVEVRKSEKTSIEDYGDMKMSGDIIINSPAVKRLGARKVADYLRGFKFLDNIEINGQSGRDLSAIVFDSTRPKNGNIGIADMIASLFGGEEIKMGDLAGGDVIITSKQTESLVIPFLERVTGQRVDSSLFERYWRGLAGRVWTDTEVEDVQQQMAALMGGGIRQMGGRPGRYLGPGRNRRALGR